MKGSLPKQFINIGRRPILLRTLERFQSAREVDCIAVVVDKKYIEKVRRMAVAGKISKVCAVVRGGRQRQDSVWNGIKALQNQNVDIVLVHDAVRPFVSPELIRIVTLIASQKGAVIPATHPKDTIKVGDNNRIVKSTIPRGRLWAVQTPQAFRFKVLLHAFQKARKDHFHGTDESGLIERLKIPVEIVEGNHDNIKITTREDLLLAQIIAKRPT